MISVLWAIPMILAIVSLIAFFSYQTEQDPSHQRPVGHIATLLLGSILVLLVCVFVYNKGLGRVDLPSRLCYDQVYWVLGQVTDPENERPVLVVRDYEGKRFALSITPEESLEVINAKTIMIKFSDETNKDIVFTHIGNPSEKAEATAVDEPEEQQQKE